MFGEYDEDLNDERQRCMHGTFVGSWWGPDYLCGPCEDGATVLATVARERWSVRVTGLNSTTGAEVEALVRCYTREQVDSTIAAFAHLPCKATAEVEHYTEQVWVRPEDLNPRPVAIVSDEEEII